MGENGSRIWYWLLGAAALLALLSLRLFDEGPPAGETTGAECEVEGKVSDTTGNAVTSFQLTVKPTAAGAAQRQFVVTSQRGTFAFSVPRGTFVLTCTADGYTPYERTITVTSDRYWHPIKLGE